MHTAYFNRFAFDLPAECVADCSHAGPCDADVSRWLLDPQIDAQLNAIAPADIREELSETGGWEYDELTDELSNRERILWVAAGNCRENVREQEQFANALLQWHGGQYTALYAVGSCMLSDSDKCECYWPTNHGHDWVAPLAVAELRACNDPDASALAERLAELAPAPAA